MLIVQRFSARAAVVVYQGFLGIFLAAFLLHHLGDLLPEILLTLIVTIILAGFMSYAIVRFTIIQQWLCWMSPAALVLPILFLTNSNIQSLLVAESGSKPGIEFSGSEFPIVWVIFDKLPTAALIDSEKNIDASRYPNFAEFAEHAYWFRNATSSAQDTITSLPTMLTGRYPTAKKTPNFVTYPENIFTLLDRAYHMNVLEHATHLCPAKICNLPGDHDARFRTLLDDLLLVYLHIILPPGLTAYLPSMEGMTSHFWPGSKQNSDRIYRRGPKRMDNFIQSISSEADWFHYAHFDIPHGPYRYYPSGKRYTRVNITPGLLKNWGYWGDDPLPIDKALQRFLAQVQLADNMLGKLISHLKDLGIYDQALIIVTSDHGCTFKAGEHTRAITKTNYRNIIYVPLFIKQPYQAKGIKSDINVELVDIFPSILDLLLGDIPWEVDGESVFADPRNKQGKMVRAYLNGKRDLYPFSAENGGEFKSLEPLSTRLKWDEHNSWNYIPGDREDLIGKYYADVLDQFYPYLDESDSGYTTHFPPSTPNPDFERASGWIRGVLKTQTGMPDRINVAVILNGEIVAVTASFQHEGAKYYFTELLPEYLHPFNNKKLTVRILKPKTEVFYSAKN